MEEQRFDKPRWLEKLEQESYQAELIISGLAILGSFQLPGLINRFGEWGLTYFSTEAYLFLNLILIYLQFGASVLISAFIIHFALRAYWIGLVGLRSVFPQGIVRENSNYSAYFVDELVKEYPEKNYGINSLDQFCSAIFAFCSYLIMIFLAYNFDIIILFGLKQLLDLFLPASVVSYLGIGILFFFVLYSLLWLFLNIKRNRENKKLQIWGYKLFRVYALLTLNFFRKPATYLAFTFMTNIKFGRYVLYLVLGMIPLTVFSLYNIVQSRAVFLASPELFFESYERTDRLQPEIYESNLSSESGRL